MKKRILSLFLSLALVMGAFPANVYAAEDGTTNTAPYIISGETNVTATSDQRVSYTLTYGDVFADAEEDTLTYYWSTDAGATFTEADGETSFSYACEEAGTVNLAFKAYDGELYSEIYNVTLTVDANSQKKFTVPSDADFTLFYQSKYYVVEELEPISKEESTDGTTITYIYEDERTGTYGAGYSYRMTDPEGKIMLRSQTDTRRRMTSK